MSILKLSGFVMTTILLLSACSETTSHTSETTTSASSPASEANTSSETAKETITIATEANFFPLRYRDGTEFAGYQIELLQQIAKAANMNATFVATKDARNLNLLPKANYTATLGTFDATPENKQLADFTDPITTMTYMIHLKNEKNGTGTLADLKGKKISIDSYYASNPEFIKLLTQLTGSESNIFVRDTFFLAWKAMISGEVDGVFGENLVMDYTLLTHGKKVDLHVKKIDLNLPENHRSLLVKKGNEALVKRFNDGLAKMKTDGSYDTLYRKWFENSEHAQAK